MSVQSGRGGPRRAACSLRSKDCAIRLTRDEAEVPFGLSVTGVLAGRRSLKSIRSVSGTRLNSSGGGGGTALGIGLGDREAPSTVYVQVPGAGFQVAAGVFRDELARNRTLNLLMLRYAHAFINQVAQSAACVHLHRVEQRCCRWLLMTHDRVQGDEFGLSHEFLAVMLGARRPTVTLVAGSLQRAGVIRYKHGHVRILDRGRLEDLSCECYVTIRRHFARLHL